MAREGRQKSESGVYHVLLRGVDKLFLNSADYAAFRARMSEHICGDAKLLAYLLLPNRVHLLIKEGEAGLSAVIKPMCTSYARYFNRTYSAEGKLFYDRFKSVPAESDTEIADTTAFFNAVGERFAEAENFSLEEYRSGSGICDIDALRAIIGSDMLSCAPRTLHLDDYEQLTAQEQEVYLQLTAGLTAGQVAALDRQSEEFVTLFSGRGASARKLLPIFGIKNITAVRQKSMPKIKKEKAEIPLKEPEQAPMPKQKRDLSVWLL